ncbi:hypothetical protein [Escherichia coli]|uniref:hypothetical protein n=1 Tax=Escherichia coli TaxID=562 RepID=UPI00388D0B1E|nr:phage tail length tape measure family protein [Escherichia coli]
MSEQVGSLQIDIDLRTKNLLVSQRQAETALDDIGDAITGVERKTKTLNTQLTKTSRAVGSSLKGAFQQAGYQIQDFVVQVQSGQNALVALSQQGSQLLSAFGGWGIALGAALTVGVSLFNGLKGGAEEATDKAEVFEKALSELNQVIRMNEQGTAALSNEYAVFARQSAEAARMVETHIRLKLQQAQQAARDYMSDILESQNATAGFGMIGSDSLGDLLDKAQGLGVTTYDLSTAIDELNQNGMYGAGIAKELTRELDDLSDKTGIEKEALFDLCQELKAVSNEPTAETLTAIYNRMAELNPTTEEGKRLLAEWAEAIEKVARGVWSAEEAVKALKGGFDELMKADVTSWANEQIKALRIKRIEFEKGKRAAYEAALAEKGVTGELKDQLMAEYDATEAAQQRREEQKRAEREAVSSAKRAAAEKARIAKQEKAEAERQAKQLAAQKEQGGRFTQQVMTEYQTTVDPRTGQALNPAAQIDAQEQQKIEALRKYRALGVLEEQQYQDALTAIQETATMRRLELVQQESDEQRQAYMQLSNSMGSLFGSMADAVGNSLGEQSGAYRALFAVQQAFTIASAMMSTQKAMADALAEGATFSQKMAGVAAAASLGASIISTINGISFSGGRYNGGAVGAGNLYRVGEHGKPEIFKANNGSQYMIPGENGRVIPGRDLVGGGGITMNNTFNITTQGGWSEEDSTRLQQTMKQVAMGVIREQSTRPGGLIAPRRK